MPLPKENNFLQLVFILFFVNKTLDPDPISIHPSTVVDPDSLTPDPQQYLDVLAEPLVGKFQHNMIILHRSSTKLFRIRISAKSFGSEDPEQWHWP